MDFPYGEIENKIGYSFKNRELLLEAFTHSTYVNVYGGRDNERMEYLGDAVLQLVVTEWQFERYQKADEGMMTRGRQKLVCEEALLDAVRGLGIEKYLLVAGSRSNVGKKTVSSLFETVTAAIYLDGGYTQARKFIEKFGLDHIRPRTENSKGELQEYLQDLGEKPPVYETEKIGKDNAPVFYATASALGRKERGEGKSKRQAEQSAAANLLRALKTSPRKEKPKSKK